MPSEEKKTTPCHILPALHGKRVFYYRQGNVFPEDGKSRVISVVGKRILKSGMWSEIFLGKGGILGTKIGQKSGILVQDLLQKSGMYQVNFFDLCHG